MVLNRRQFLAGAAAGAAGSAVTSCRAADVLGLRPQVRVAVSWSATELQAFRKVLDRLSVDQYGIDLVPLGDDIETALGSVGSRYGRRPDIVMLPRPGLVAAHLKRGDLAPLPYNATATWRYAKVWDLPAADGAHYGLPFKMAHKSAVWYRKDVFKRFGLEIPATWGEWLDLNDQLLANGVPPLALGAADGWVLTDFFENVLLGCAPAQYRALERRQPGLWTDRGVQQAFRLLGRMWAAPGVLAGGLDRSLAQQFPDAVVEVFGHGHAAMVLSADYAELVIRQFGDPLNAGVFPFPVVAGAAGALARTQPPLVVGGDVAVLAASPSEQAKDLVAKLAEPAAPLPWIDGYGGFLAANPQTSDRHYSPELAGLADQLSRQPAGPIAFDLSDQLGALGGSDGLWQVLQDLLVKVVTSGPQAVEAAAAEACRAMSDLEAELGQGGG
jgi:alpha-glucoside transport system substrate-binding protein